MTIYLLLVRIIALKIHHSETEDFVFFRYHYDIDIYGYCGSLSCPKLQTKSCDNIVNKHYKFYLAFENSFSEDYITEKALRALQNNAVPIVYGGSNYKRYEFYVTSSMKEQHANLHVYTYSYKYFKNNS